MTKYVQSLRNLLPEEKRKIFDTRYKRQEKNGGTAFFIALMLGGCGAHHAYFSGSPLPMLGWTAVTVGLALVGGALAVLMWVAAMIHAATGASAANDRLANELYKVLK